MPRKQTAPPSLIRDNSVLRLAYLDCHADGHQWHHEEGVVDPLDAEPGLRAPYGALARGRRSFCQSCGCERIRWYMRSGEVVPKYKHPEGYLHKKREENDEPAPSKLQWRQQLVATLFEDELPRPGRRRAS